MKIGTNNKEINTKKDELASNLNNLKIIFFGTPLFAKEILENLVKKKVPVSLVVTQPDKPVGRKQIITPSPVKSFAEENDTPIVQFDSISEKQIQFFETEKPDLFIVAAFGMILPKKLIELPRFGSINVHASLLPELRGPSPIHEALMQNKKETGTSIMLMDEGVDTGAVLTQKKVAIEDHDKYPQLEKKIIEASNEILVPTLENWIDDKIEPQQQDNSLATQTKMITKKDGLVDWNKSAYEIYGKFRAFCDWPKIHSLWNKKKITLVEIGFDNSFSHVKKPGEVFHHDNKVAIATAKGAILPEKIQLEGKQVMAVDDFINGHPDFIGSILG